MSGRGRCRGCGDEVEIDCPPDGHTRVEVRVVVGGHTSDCIGWERGGCDCPGELQQEPYPVLCGPVDGSESTRRDPTTPALGGQGMSADGVSAGEAAAQKARA